MSRYNPPELSLGDLSSHRHRATNMFLDAYKRNWLETEGYSFEDKMIDDLSVSHPPLNSETHNWPQWHIVYTMVFVIHVISNY